MPSLNITKKTRSKVVRKEIERVGDGRFIQQMVSEGEDSSGDRRNKRDRVRLSSPLIYTLDHIFIYVSVDACIKIN